MKYDTIYDGLIVSQRSKDPAGAHLAMAVIPRCLVLTKRSLRRRVQELDRLLASWRIKLSAKREEDGRTKIWFTVSADRAIKFFRKCVKHFRKALQIAGILKTSIMCSAPPGARLA